MSFDYRPGQRELQDHFDTRRLADRLAQGAGDSISDGLQAFIEAQDHLFIATVDEDGMPQCSHKGGDPGFVRVVDPRLLVFPLFDGNGMFLTAGNLRSGSSKVGLLFIDLEGGSRLRVGGNGSIDLDDPLLAEFPGARCVVRVEVTQVFVNCKRYVHRYQRVARSPFVPAADGSAPVPDWKKDPWFEGALPAGDPALDPTCPTEPAIPQFP